MARVFDMGSSLTDMLNEFSEYAGTGKGLAAIWDRGDDEIFEACKLMTIDAYLQTCRAMIDELDKELKYRKEDYLEVELKEPSD